MLDVKVASLLAVAKHKNITKAAGELALTQPAVSHHIKELEKQLGIKIFVRGKGSMLLTDAGEVAVRYAKRMNSLNDKMHTAIADGERQVTRLRVGITHTAESNYVAEVLAKYSNENDGIIITIITDSIKNLYTMLENYEIDLAIVEGNLPAGSQFNSLLLDTDYLVCAVCNDNPLAKHAMVTLADLRTQRMILRSAKSGTVNLLGASLASINQSIDSLNVVMEVDNIATIKDLIRMNLGVSILPRSTCMNEVNKGKMTILPVENMSMIRETNIVYQKDFSHIEILRDITELYKRTVSAART